MGREKGGKSGGEHGSIHDRPCCLTFDQVLTSKLDVRRDQVENLRSNGH